MAGESWSINPVTGDYDQKNGAPVVTEKLTIPAYIRLRAKRTTWMYAPDNKWGSNFYLQKKRKTSQDPSFFENLAADALQPIVDDGRASSVTVTTTVSTRGGMGMETEVVDATGKVEKIVIDPIVV